jgi:hypothetical protein
MTPLAIRVLEAGRIDYDGSQLRAHFLREQLALKGNAAGAFIGRCDVRGAGLVDLEDRESGRFIHSPEMLHLLVELFGAPLPVMILWQRLLASHAADLVREGALAAAGLVRRKGDDVFVGARKLTVSIATVSPVSGLLHFGVNVRTEGAPVPAVGLAELGLSPPGFAAALLERLAAEMAELEEARCKVRPAGAGPGA